MYNVYQICSTCAYRMTTSKNDDVQDFDVRWDQALLSSNDTPTDIIKLYHHPMISLRI